MSEKDTMLTVGELKKAIEQCDGDTVVYLSITCEHSGSKSTEYETIVETDKRFEYRETTTFGNYIVLHGGPIETS